MTLDDKCHEWKGETSLNGGFQPCKMLSELYRSGFVYAELSPVISRPILKMLKRSLMTTSRKDFICEFCPFCGFDFHGGGSKYRCVASTEIGVNIK